MNMNQKRAIELLKAGFLVEDYRESGNSMTPIIKHRQPVTIAPVRREMVDVGDVVMAKVRGKIWLHKVSAASPNLVQISNNRGHVNGWANREHVYGIVVSVEGKSRRGAVDKAVSLFPPHEHAGDKEDPDHCVYTLPDGDRCQVEL